MAAFIDRPLQGAGGLVMRSVGDTMSVSPPLVMTRAEMNEPMEEGPGGAG